MEHSIQLPARQYGRHNKTFEAIWHGYKSGTATEDSINYHKEHLDGFSEFFDLQIQAESSKDFPILFSAPMVRAILDDTKTQTRRLATSPLRNVKPGDRLYIREAFRTAPCFDHLAPAKLKKINSIDFEADNLDQFPSSRLRPAMHMPRFMSRATLTVTDVKRECLQDITAEDALNEGITEFDETAGVTTNPVQAFKTLWNALHGEDSGKSWADNPELVAISFTMKKINIDGEGA